ncbi:MAG TPA: ATP-binding protein, partial [Gemmatimonadaceae bacterium]|nr:ATP-binding protein [Gemmatimonadaceae bacterium]
MRLAQRLLLGSLALLLTLILVVVTLSDEHVGTPLERLVQDRLEGEARLLGRDWSPNHDPDSFADTAGALLGARVTLVGPDGRVVGDSDESTDNLPRLENHASRPEIRGALDSGVGRARRTSASLGREQLYVAVRAPLGVVRLSVDPANVDSQVRRTQWSVLVVGATALLVASALAMLFARGFGRQLAELRDVAQALASGDLSRRPVLAAPGEVGELAAAVHRMAEQLDSRLQAMERDDLLLAATIESLSEGVIVVDSARQVIRANDAARHLLGVDDSPPFASERLPRDRVLRDALAEALEGGTTEEMEFAFGDRMLVLRAKSLADGGAVLAVRDVTASRRLEATRRDFVANVSHELKTPLTVISGFAETLLDEEGEPAQRRRFAEAIQSSAHRMQRMVDDLLDLSRIESGGWKPAPTTLDTSVVVGDTLLPFRPAAERKGITLDVDIAPDVRTVYADATALRQILSNLVDNAIRHTAAGGRVTAFATVEDNGVWIGVRDTGVGISPAHLPRIFERFYRVDAARSRDGGGTGLGLAIVKHLIEGHGGRVRAESVQGSGTTIAAFFPS